MNAIPFDTLKLARALRDKAHFTTEQAEGAADALAEAIQSDLATKTDLNLISDGLKADLNLVSASLKAEISAVKADLNSVSASLKAEISAVKAELRTEIAETKGEIIKWLFGTVGVQTIIIIGTIIALARAIHP